MGDRIILIKNGTFALNQRKIELEDAGYRVVATASNQTEAIEVLNNPDIKADLIWTDAWIQRDCHDRTITWIYELRDLLHQRGLPVKGD